MASLVEKEKESIDNYLTTATITLIAGYLILFSITKFNSKIATWLAISSLFCFIVTLLFNFWYKFRRAYKRELLDKEIDDCLDKEVDVFIDYAELIKPIAETKFLEIYKSELTENTTGSINEIQKAVNKPELDEKFDKDLKEVLLKNKGILHSLTENLFNKLDSKKDKILRKPLNEKYRRLKFTLDYLSFKSRYFLFCLGLALFLTSIILNNLDITSNNNTKVTLKPTIDSTKNK